MRKFDLKAVLKGEPVQYRDFTPYLSFLRFIPLAEPRLELTRVGESCEHITADLDGKVLYCTDDGDTQLHMAPKWVKKTVYINLYPDEEYPTTKGTFGMYFNRDMARRMASTSAVAVAVPVEIEVEEESS